MELGEGFLSQRRLEVLLKTRGYSLSHGLISPMGYAVDTLLPAMPQALHAGLGRPQVERLRALDKAAGALWRHYGLGDETAFREIFAQLCRRYDGPDWDIAPLRAALETELAEHADTSIHTVRAQLAERLVGRAIETSPTKDIPEAVTEVDAAMDRTKPASSPDDSAHQAKDERALIPPQAHGEDDEVADHLQDWEKAGTKW
ncbi:MAG: hypothetical protein U9Q81_09830 [Pseudomonadota bacterium]|nr:hypothetical protein [Pseudomonadota bacterium]